MVASIASVPPAASAREQTSAPRRIWVALVAGLAAVLLGAAGARAVTGACCQGTTCTIRTQALCDSVGGEYFGGSCSPNPCGIQLGRCCSLGNCTFIAEGNCQSSWTLGGSCSPNPCPPPKGACCIGGECTVTTQASCTGAWSLTSALCAPNPCAPPPCGISIPNRIGGETTATATVFNSGSPAGLLVARGTRLEILNLTTPTPPAAFFPPRRTGLPAPAVKIVHTPGSQRAWVLLENGDVSCVTTSGAAPDVTGLRTIDSFDNVDLDASGDTVYIAHLREPDFGGPSGLSTWVDIWQRGAGGDPVFITRIEPFLQNFEIQRVLRIGNILWLVMHEHNSFVLGLEGWNVSNPALPTRVTSSLDFTSPGQITDVHAVAAGGNTLFVASRSDTFGLDDDSIRAVDVSNPASPVWRPAVNLNGIVSAMMVSGSFMYVSLFGAVQTWNISNPASMSLAGTYTDASLVVNQLAPGGSAAATDYWACGSRGLLTMDVSSPASISQRSASTVVPARASAAGQSGSSTIVYDSAASTLRVFDLSLAESQQLRGSLAIPNFATMLEVTRVNNGTVPVACVAGNDIAIVEVSSPTTPVLRATIPISPRMMAAAGDRLYVFTHAHELVVISIANPASPVIMSTTQYGGTESDYNSMTAWETAGGATRAVALGTRAFGL